MHVKLRIIITAINCTENIIQKQNNVLSAVWRCNNCDIVWQCIVTIDLIIIIITKSMIVTNDKSSHIGIWKNALIYMIYSSNSWASHLPTDIVLYFRLHYAAASLALSGLIALVLYRVWQCRQNIISDSIL